MGKLKRSFRTRYEMRHRLFSIMVMVAAFVLDHFTSDWIVGFLGLPDGSAKEWLDALYATPFILTGLWLAAWLNREG